MCIDKMTTHQYRIRAGLALLSASGDSIVLVRGAKSSKWSLPKGKVEPNETPMQAAVRECEEETGIPVRDYRIHPKLFVKNNCSIFGAQMKESTDTSVLLRPHEIDEIRWVPLVDLDDYASTANDSLRYLIAKRDTLFD